MFRCALEGRQLSISLCATLATIAARLRKSCYISWMCAIWLLCVRNLGSAHLVLF